MNQIFASKKSLFVLKYQLLQIFVNETVGQTTVLFSDVHVHFKFPSFEKNQPNVSPQFVIYRSSVARRTCSSTRRSTCARRSRTSVPSARRRSRTPRTCPSTPGSTWASSRTAARFASGSSPN